MTSAPKSKAFEAEPPLTRQFVTIGAGVAGALLFTWMNVPAGGMSGAMAGVALAGSIWPAWIVGIGTGLRYLAMLASGVSIGASVTPETVRNIATYPASVTGMVVCVFCMIAASVFVSMKFSRWDRMTAMLAAIPGAMGFVLSAVMTTGANAPRVVTVQMMRVFFLICLLPLAIVETGAGAIVPNTRISDPLWMFLIECAIGLGVGLVLTRWKVIGGMFLGAMLVSGLFHLVDVAHGRAPGLVFFAGQVLIGSWTGSRFSGFDWSHFAREAPSMLAAIGVSILISAVFSISASTLLGLPFGATFLAYSPGGMEAMTVLAMALGLDPFYVAAHHLARFVLLHVGLPLTLRYWTGDKAK